MKKTALTLVAIAFGSCVAFAQTAPQTEDKPAVNTEESITTDKMSNESAEVGLRTITVEELPVAVQESLQGDEFKAMTVVAVAQVEGQEGATTTFYQVGLAEDEAATEPSLIVLFNDKGKAVAQKEAAAPKEEN